MLHSVNNSLISWQGRSQEFTKRDKPGGLGTEVPSGVQVQNMETLNTNGAVTKIDLR